MGRTKRKRKKKKKNELTDMSKIIELQKSMKIKCPKIKIHYFNDSGWGLKCKMSLQEGDILMALPLCHLITPEVHCDIFSVLKSDNMPAQFILSLFLMYEDHLKTKSKHFNYINSLPKSYTTLYFCSEKEIKFLPNFLKEEFLSQKQTLDKYFNLLSYITNDKLCGHCGEAFAQIFVREKFAWAWFTVNTRSVYFQDEKNFKSMALAPFLDMFNHSNEAVTKMIIDFENNLYILKTLVRYKKSHQVFIKYGAHSNLKLLVEYGFILPDNENDFVEFTSEEVIRYAAKIDSEFGKLSKLKLNFIDSMKLNRILTKNKECFSWNFNMLAGVLITGDQDLLQLQSKIYSDNFTSEEKASIQKIGDAAAAQKLIELQKSFEQMENVKNCSASFMLAKNLLKIHMSLLC